VLERHFARRQGFSSRVRRLEIGTGAVETVFQSPIGDHDNLEGLAVWRDESGAIRLTMVSDDNFRRALQETEFVEYVLDPAAAGG